MSVNPDAGLDALNTDRLVICAIVALQLICSARTGSDVEQLDAELDALRDVPVSRGTIAAARVAMTDLAAQGFRWPPSRAATGRHHRRLRSLNTVASTFSSLRFLS